MQRKLAMLLVTVCFVQLAAAQTNNQPDSRPDPRTVEWIAAHAVRLKTPEAGHGFADMKPLRKIIGNARIVSLGEATHGTREFFQLKHRMLEFLASEMGFTIFTIEANMPEAYRLNDYVLNGTGDPAKLLKGMYFWTWDTQEVLEMIKWMREFNKSGKGRVQFTGFDMQTPDVAIGIVRDFVARHDVPFVGEVDQAAAITKAVQSAEGPPFAVATASFPIQAAAGKRIRFSGYIKTQGITRGWAGLWWRVDGKSGVLAFDNMKDRGATGTIDWTRYEIDLPVAADVTNINFGALHTGDGSAWFDGLKVTVDGQPYEDKTKLDLDFESSSPVGFFTGGAGYQVTVDKRFSHSGNQSLLMRYTPPPPIANGGGVATSVLPAGTAIGKRVRLSGYIKTRDVSQGFAGLWLRIDGPSGVLAFDNMQDRGVTGTTDWERHEVELSVPAGARNIVFGALFPANGTGWLDSVRLEVDDVAFPGSNSAQLDFELPTPVGFDTKYGGDPYQVQIDHDVFHTGKQSLRMNYVGTAPKPVEPKAAVAAWQAVMRHLEESRSLYAKNGIADRELEWVIQNARIVIQCNQMRANEVSRDQSMAENVKWIADHNPDAKIVLWAHNGHVSTADSPGYKPMGASLREMFGDKMVVFGFAFNQGSFQAAERNKGLHDFTVSSAPAGSLDATLARTGIPLFALDLRKAPKNSAVATWLSQPHKSRSIGALFSNDMENQFLTDLTPTRSFDVLLFVEKTTAARKNGP
jgi:erythromycin esterase-like protein